jgi:methylenetetrahydrofolate dehydrogenase (NADP+)/methenyltetrahydrofolate cyclohydrolase
MGAQIIDGKAVAGAIRAELKEGIAGLKGKGIVPGLAVILVGQDPASVSYVTAKSGACADVGIRSFDHRLPAAASMDEILGLVRECNSSPDVNGILVQLPLQRHHDEDAVLLAIDPAKDVDGFHPMNVGRMVIGQQAFLPCTPNGVVQLLLRSGVKTTGANVVIVGRSNVVGKPLANLLMQKREGGNATVTVCHTRTRNIAEHTLCADIVVAAAGKPGTITADMVREGVVVIDVGVNRVEDSSKKSGFRLVGDVDFAGVSKKASLITPVPGGVGPMTIAMLLTNTVLSARMAHGLV